MEYLKDWRIWLMCIVVLIVIALSDLVWAEQHITPSDTWTEFDWRPKKKKKKQHIDFHVNGVKCKWKLNKVEAKYKFNDDIQARFNVVAVDFNKGKAIFTLIFTF